MKDQTNQPTEPKSPYSQNTEALCLVAEKTREKNNQKLE
jgi:hypothetical protein